MRALRRTREAIGQPQATPGARAVAAGWVRQRPSRWGQIGKRSGLDDFFTIFVPFISHPVTRISPYLTISLISRNIPPYRCTNICYCLLLRARPPDRRPRTRNTQLYLCAISVRTAERPNHWTHERRLTSCPPQHAMRGTPSSCRLSHAVSGARRRTSHAGSRSRPPHPISRGTWCISAPPRRPCS